KSAIGNFLYDGKTFSKEPMNLPDLKEIIKTLFGPFYKPVRDYVFGPFYGVISGLWDPTQNIFMLYLLTSAVIALLVYKVTYANGKSLSLSNFFRYLAPKEIYTHKSALIDYKFFVVNAYVYKFLLGWTVIFSSQLLGDKVASLLRAS